MDGTIPTSRLPEVLRRIGEMSDSLRPEGRQHLPRRRRQSASADHVRRQRPRQLPHAPKQFGADILKLCVEVGGCLTGEHGVGVEKRDLMGVQFTDTELDAAAAASRPPSIPAGC